MSGTPRLQRRGVRGAYWTARTSERRVKRREPQAAAPPRSIDTETAAALWRQVVVPAWRLDSREMVEALGVDPSWTGSRASRRAVLLVELDAGRDLPPYLVPGAVARLKRVGR